MPFFKILLLQVEVLVTQSYAADGTVPFGPLPPISFPSAALIRLYELLKNNS